MKKPSKKNHLMKYFYENKLWELKNIGIGNRTKYDEVVTEKMIKNIVKRLKYFGWESDEQQKR